MTAVGILGTLMAGWASANKYSLLGAMRAPPSCVLELPMVLAVASLALAAGSLSLRRHRRGLVAVVAGLAAAGCIVFLVPAVAELHRPPFDMPIADSEIVFGP